MLANRFDFLLCAGLLDQPSSRNFTMPILAGELFPHGLPHAISLAPDVKPRPASSDHCG